MGMADADAKEQPKLISEENADLRDLPAGVSISYTAANADYRTGNQQIRRPENLDATTQMLEYSTPLVMTDNGAMQAADIILNETRETPYIYRTTLGPKYLELTPGDVVNLPLDDSRTVTAALFKMEGEAILDCEFRQRSMVYTSDAIGAPTPGAGIGGTYLTNPALLYFLAIDGHLMQAGDDGDDFYFGVARTDFGEFTSATVYRSTDGGNTYEPWEGITDELPRGFALAALPNRPHPESWDRTTAFTINIASVFTAPASVSEETLLSDITLNGFAVKAGNDWEYIRAASVVDNANGTWTLSTLLRGRKGTDFAMSGHVAGDLVVYVSPLILERSDDSASDRNLMRSYVPVAAYAVFDTASAVMFTNTGRGLRPWSPINIEGSRDGSSNLTINWTRRDRLGQDWPESGPEDPPMSETVEDYDVIIYNGGTPVRTIPAATQTAAYSAADQTTDFGSPQSSIALRIAQVSTTYGNGVERVATV
jgi:hypothetical protein